MCLEYMCADVLLCIMCVSSFSFLSVCGVHVGMVSACGAPTCFMLFFTCHASITVRFWFCMHNVHVHLFGVPPPIDNDKGPVANREMKGGETRKEGRPVCAHACV